MTDKAEVAYNANSAGTVRGTIQPDGGKGAKVLMVPEGTQCVHLRGR